jgi:hypothetical protein
MFSQRSASRYLTETRLVLGEETVSLKNVIGFEVSVLKVEAVKEIRSTRHRPSIDEKEKFFRLK